MRLLFFVLLIAFAHNSFANNTVLDFDSLIHTDVNFSYHGRLYSEDGYNLNAKFDSINIPDFGFASWGTLSQNYTGNPSLINDAGPGFTTLTKADNQLFNLLSIDLAGLFIEFPAFGVTGINVTFTGTKVDNSLISQTFTGPLTSSTYTFNNFTNLSKVEWLQDNDTLGLHQFDNIVLSPIPEPSMALLLGGGLIGMAVLRHKKLIKHIT